MRVAHAISFVVSMLGVERLQAQQGALSILIRPTAIVKKERVDSTPDKVLEQRWKSAQDSSRALAKSFEKVHGKKRENWPADAGQQYAAALNTTIRAAADVHYAQVNPEDLKEVEKTLAEAITRESMSGTLRLAASMADADLVIDVRGVHAEKTSATFIKPNDCRQLLSVQPGGREGSVSRLAAVPSDWAPEVDVPAVRVPLDASMTQGLIIEATSGGGSIIRCWGKATDAAIATLKHLQRAMSAGAANPSTSAVVSTRGPRASNRALGVTLASLRF